MAKDRGPDDVRTVVSMVRLWSEAGASVFAFRRIGSPERHLVELRQAQFLDLFKHGFDGFRGSRSVAGRDFGHNADQLAIGVFGKFPLTLIGDDDEVSPFAPGIGKALDISSVDQIPNRPPNRCHRQPLKSGETCHRPIERRRVGKIPQRYPLG